MPLPSCGEAHVLLLLLCRRQSFGGGGYWMGLILVFSCFFGLLSQSTVDKLIKKTNLALVVGTNSWRDQFMEAITVSAGTATEAACCHLESETLETKRNSPKPSWFCSSRLQQSPSQQLG